MIINKILETDVDLINPNDIYQHNIDNLLLEKLNDRYKNRCYQKSYILNVNKIIRRSTIKMVSNRLDGGSYISVQFEVSTFMLNPEDVLHNCKIIEIHENAIIAEHELVGIKLQKIPNSKISHILKIGQVIPVIIKSVRYIPYQPKISVIAVPYLPVCQPNIFYNIISGLTVEQTEKLGLLFDMIQEEEEKHKNIQNDKKYQFFKDLVYPHKVNIKYEQTSIAEKNKFKPVNLELKEMLLIKDGIIVSPNEDNINNKRFFHSKNTDLLNKVTVITSELFPVYAVYLKKYLVHKMLIRGFVETYKTTEDMNKLMIYWKLCKDAKQ